MLGTSKNLLLLTLALPSHEGPACLIFNDSHHLMRLSCLYSHVACTCTRARHWHMQNHTSGFSVFARGQASTPSPAVRLQPH